MGAGSWSRARASYYRHRENHNRDWSLALGGLCEFPWTDSIIARVSAGTFAEASPTSCHSIFSPRKAGHPFHPEELGFKPVIRRETETAFGSRVSGPSHDASTDSRATPFRTAHHIAINVLAALCGWSIPARGSLSVHSAIRQSAATSTIPASNSITVKIVFGESRRIRSPLAYCIKQRPLARRVDNFPDIRIVDWKEIAEARPQARRSRQRDIRTFSGNWQRSNH